MCDALKTALGVWQRRQIPVFDMRSDLAGLDAERSRSEAGRVPGIDGKACSRLLYLDVSCPVRSALKATGVPWVKAEISC